MPKATIRKKVKSPTIMISSSVYGMEAILDQIYAVLSGFGWNVWMSHKGTVPVDSDFTAFQNCLNAVENCDVFLGIISSHYGSGVSPGEKGITHLEIEKAVKLKKKRWFLVKSEVVVSKELLKPIKKTYPKFHKRVSFKNNPVLNDIRILDMHNSAMRTEVTLPERTGNWVQTYRDHTDILRYIEAQLSNPQTVFSTNSLSKKEFS